MPGAPFSSLEDLAQAALALGGRPRVAIARCADSFVLKSGVHAAERGLAEPIFVGDIARTRQTAESLGIDITPFETVDVPDDQAAVFEAISLYRQGRASLIMKGQVSTDVMLKAVLDKERGAPPKGIFSHVAAFFLPGRERMTLLTDAAVNIKPTLQRKAEIVNNALSVARALGIERPKVALLAATEKVNYRAMPATLDADVLTKMGQQGQFGDAQVFGPLSLDLAVSPSVAAHKGVDNPVAGHADILCAPDIESGNVLYKSLNTLMGLDLAGVVVGSTVPIVVPSRGDSERTKFYSLALAVYLTARLHYPEPGQDPNIPRRTP